jgi:hypothetical protein
MIVNDGRVTVVVDQTFYLKIINTVMRLGSLSSINTEPIRDDANWTSKFREQCTVESDRAIQYVLVLIKLF